MRAIVFKKYGSPSELKLQDVAKPTPVGDEVLIRVMASSINDWDAGILSGTPLMMRMWYGFRKPKPRVQIVGCDVSGIVEEVGCNASRFKIGDAVYGDLHGSGFGAFAEYATAKEAHLAPKPDALDFEDAAAVPHSATIAWQTLNSGIELKAGQKVLINGAGGGVGPIAIKLLKQKEVEVTGVDRADKFEMMKTLGFDHVIDYQQQDFACSGKTYDFIFDNRTCHLPWHYLKALNPGGSYFTVGGSTPKIFTLLFLSWFIKRLSGKTFKMIGLKTAEGLEEMAPYVESGLIKPIVDGPYALADASEAMAYYLSGKQKGRIIIKVASPYE